MVDDNKFERTETLRKASWESYCSRREYEWKMSFGFWAALIALAAVLLKGEGVAASPAGANAPQQNVLWGLCQLQTLQILLAFGSLAALYLHFRFMSFIKVGHYIDQKRHERCLGMQRDLREVEDIPEVKALTKDIEDRRRVWLKQLPWYTRFWQGNGLKSEDEAPNRDKPFLVIRWVSAHLFQLQITLLLLLAINVLVWLSAPAQ